ncbi:MAG TPA: hypothetical protein PKA37_09400 [Planctomycetota bacterium]|nr:hypothetical protein [Planctomycetota bacterium]
MPWCHLFLGLVLLLAVFALPREGQRRGVLPLHHIAGEPVLSAVLDYGDILRTRGSESLRWLARDGEVLACAAPWIADPDRAFPRWSRFVLDVSGLDLRGGIRFLSHRLTGAWYGGIDIRRRDGRAAHLPDLLLAVEFDQSLTEVARLVEALRTEPLIWGLGESYDVDLAGQRMSHYVSNDPEGLEAYYGVIDRTLILTTSRDRLSAFLVRRRGDLRTSIDVQREAQLATVVWAPPDPLTDAFARVGWVQELQRWLAVLDVKGFALKECVRGAEVETSLELSHGGADSRPTDARHVILPSSGIEASLPWAALAKVALDRGEPRPGFSERMRRAMIQDLLVAGGDRVALRWSDLRKLPLGDGLSLHLPDGDPTKALGALRRAALFAEFSVRGEALAFQVQVPWQGKDLLLDARALAGGGMAVTTQGAPSGLPFSGRDVPLGVAAYLSAEELSWLLWRWSEQQAAAAGVPTGPWPERPDLTHRIGTASLECDTQPGITRLLLRSHLGGVPLVPLLFSDG